MRPTVAGIAEEQSCPSSPANPSVHYGAFGSSAQQVPLPGDLVSLVQRRNVKNQHQHINHSSSIHLDSNVPGSTQVWPGKKWIFRDSAPCFGHNSPKNLSRQLSFTRLERFVKASLKLHSLTRFPKNLVPLLRSSVFGCCCSTIRCPRIHRSNCSWPLLAGLPGPELNRIPASGDGRKIMGICCHWNVWWTIASLLRFKSHRSYGNCQFGFLSDFRSSPRWPSFLAPSPSAAWVGLVGALQLRQFTGGLAGGEVDGLEDLLVQLPRLVLGTMGTMSQRCPFTFSKDPTKRMGVGRWVKYDIIWYMYRWYTPQRKCEKYGARNH